MSSGNDNYERLARSYIDQAILKNKPEIIDELFLNNQRYCSEFGDTWSNEGVKTHLKFWKSLFKIIDLHVFKVEASGSIIAVDFFETLLHVNEFKSIKSTKKEIESKGKLVFNFSGNKISEFYIRRNIDDIALQLVDYDEETLEKISSKPILKNPYDIPIEILQRHMQLSGISLTSSQIKCLCVWSMFDESEYISEIIGLDIDEVDSLKETLKHSFKCNSTYELMNVMRQRPLTYYVMEAFDLMLTANNPFFKSENMSQAISWPEHVI